MTRTRAQQRRANALQRERRANTKAAAPPKPAARVPTVYAYCRVSLDRLESVSIETQEAMIRAYCMHRLPDLPIVVVIDRGVSGGTKLLERPHGQRLRSAQSGDHIVATKVDRAFRSVADGAATLNDLTDRSIGVHCLDAQIDTSTPVGVAMLQMLIVFAELERKRIAERQRDAAAHRRARGDCMHIPANPPFGWRVVGRKSARRYVTDPADRRRIKRLRELHDAGMGIRKLMQLCDLKGWCSRRGPWTRTTIRRAIRSARAGFPTVSERAGKWDCDVTTPTARRLKKSQFRRGEIKRKYGVATPPRRK